MAQKWAQYGKQLLTYWLVPLLCAVVSWQKGLDINWDVQNYHYYNAWAHLHDRYSIDLAPAGMQSFFNPLFDLAWYGSLQLLTPQGAGVLMGLLHGLNFLLVRAIALRVLGNVAWAAQLGWLLAAFAVMSMGFVSELGTAMHDNIVALFALSAFLLCLQAQSRPLPAQTPLLLLAGAIAGFACAAKLTSAFYALALAFALLAENCVHEDRWRNRLQPVVVYSMAVAVTMLVVGAYWYWFNWSRFDNPLFPMFNDIFHSELATPYDHRDTRFLPTNWIDWWFRPILLAFNHTLTSELPYRQYTFALVYIAAAAALVWWLIRRRHGLGEVSPRRGTVLLFVFALVSYALWLKLFGIYRYVITLELLLPLLLALLLASMLGKPRGFAIAIAVGALLSVHNVNKAPDWGHAPWSADYVAVATPADINSVGTIALMGQPLAWLVPAFNLDIPFLQIEPNISVHDSRYGEELLQRIDPNRDMRVVFDPAVYSFEQVSQRIAQGRFSLLPSACEPLQAWMGGQPFAYQYCSVTR